MTSLQSHQAIARNYQKFIDAGLPEWYEFSTQFKYAKAWADTGIFTPAEAKVWAKELEGQVDWAAKFKQLGFTLKEASAWFRNTTYSPELCAGLKRQGRAPRMIRNKPMQTR